MWHSCGNWQLEDHFRGKPPEVRALFDRLVRLLRRFGPFKIEPQKTRIVFQVRVRFAAAFPLRKGLRGHFWLTRPVPGPPVSRIEKVMARCYVHHFFIDRPEQLDPRLLSLLKEAYAIGRQEHLARAGARSTIPR